MTCPHCEGLCVLEVGTYDDGQLTEWRCVQCARRSATAVVQTRYPGYRPEGPTEGWPASRRRPRKVRLVTRRVPPRQPRGPDA